VVADYYRIYGMQQFHTDVELRCRKVFPDFSFFFMTTALLGFL
jgi:hypothetical protein